jgi:hypothetical protein
MAEEAAQLRASGIAGHRLCHSFLSSLAVRCAKLRIVAILGFRLASDLAQSRNFFNTARLAVAETWKQQQPTLIS